MHKSRLPQDIATERFEVISPLLDPNLDKNLFCEKKKELATRYSISYRTISRWFQRYQQDGFKGLIPKSPVPEKTATSAQDNFNEIVDLAIELRRECPTRSVKTIIISRKVLVFIICILLLYLLIITFLPSIM